RELNHAPLARREPAASPTATADPFELGPRPRRPAIRPERVEGRARLLERLARGAPLLEATLRAAQREQTTSAIEAQPEPSVLVGRVRKCMGRILVIAKRQFLNRGTARCRHEAPRMLLLLCEPSQSRGDGLRLFRLPDLCQRLHEIR